MVKFFVATFLLSCIEWEEGIVHIPNTASQHYRESHHIHEFDLFYPTLIRSIAAATSATRNNPLFPALRSAPTAISRAPAKSKFLAVHPAALVTMGGCKVGFAKNLLAELSVLWGGVRIQAGTANQRPAIPGLEGGVTECVLRACSYSGKTLFDAVDGN